MQDEEKPRNQRRRRNRRIRRRPAKDGQSGDEGRVENKGEKKVEERQEKVNGDVEHVSAKA